MNTYYNKVMRKIKITKNINYHIYNRGFYKRKLFKSESDYRFFMFKIANLKEELKIKIFIYCLMPNHYHFLINSGYKPEKIACFMHRLHLSYARFYNAKYNNSGHTFQGPYENKPLISKSSFRHVFEYIRCNPVDAGLVKKPQDWPYTIVYDTM